MRRALQRGAHPAVLRLYDASEADRTYGTGDKALLLALDEGDGTVIDATFELLAEESLPAGGHRGDEAHVEHWLAHRNEVSALEALTSKGYTVDTMEVAGSCRADLPTIYRATLEALLGVEGTIAASAHQSHSYQTGGCLYFTFAGQVDTDRRDAYYRELWDAGQRTVLAHGGALSHHHGVGLTAAGSWPRRSAPPTGSWWRPRRRSTRTASSTRASSACRPLGPRRRVGDARHASSGRLIGCDSNRSRPDPRRRRRHVGGAGAGGPDATVTAVQHRPVLLLPRPRPGRVRRHRPGRRGARGRLAALAAGGPVAAVGVTNQRASTIAWDRATGEPVGPGLGWQDLRTVGDCLVWQAQGLRFAERVATKAAHLLDQADPDRTRDLCVGTVDAWVAWHLSGGDVFATDAPNAGVTLLDSGHTGWDAKVLDALRIPATALPTIVDSSGVVGVASALDGSPPIAALAGDQQASLIGQGCVLPGLAKITFGTGGMLDVCVGPDALIADRQAPPARSRSPPGGGAARPCGASRRSCWPPAPTSSGCATTSASSTRPSSRTTSPPSARRPTASSTSRPAGPGHAPMGLRRPRDLLGITARGGRRSSGPSSRAWPSVAPTSWRPPRPTPAWRSTGCAWTAA